jgi:hypothetical protein
MGVVWPRDKVNTNLLVAEDLLDIAQCLSTPNHETVLDWQSHRASNPHAFSNVGRTQHIIRFRHDPKYAVLLWQQGKLHRGTDAVKDI